MLARRGLPAERKKKSLRILHASRPTSFPKYKSCRDFCEKSTLYFPPFERPPFTTTVSRSNARLNLTGLTPLQGTVTSPLTTWCKQQANKKYVDNGTANGTPVFSSISTIFFLFFLSSQSCQTGTYWPWRKNPRFPSLLVLSDLIFAASRFAFTSCQNIVVGLQLSTKNKEWSLWLWEKRLNRIVGSGRHHYVLPSHKPKNKN